MEMSKGKDYSISLIRLIAMVMIVACHILQSIGSELAWWLNVGVQIFFVVSGFLYGRKNIEKPGRWMSKQFTKILIDYYVFILIICIVYKGTNAYSFNLINVGINILGLQGFVSGIPNVQHLWFVTYILLCYAVTPLLNLMFEHLSHKTECKYWGGVFLLALALQILNVVGAVNVTVPWIVCYIAGYGLSKRYCNGSSSETSRNKLSLKSTALIMLPICVGLNGFEIYSKYIYKFETSNKTVKELLSLVFEYAHACLGITLFLCLLLIFNKILKKLTYKPKLFTGILDYSDRYSYDIYIVHQVFILGSFSIIGKTSSIFLDIVIITILIVISSFMLKKMSYYIRQLCMRKMQRI